MERELIDVLIFAASTNIIAFLLYWLDYYVNFGTNKGVLSFVKDIYNNITDGLCFKTTFSSIFSFIIIIISPIFIMVRLAFSIMALPVIVLLCAPAVIEKIRDMNREAKKSL